jgi:hypothetical protein
MDEVRRGKTEALFRDVNERIAESAGRFEADEAEFVCECADPTCTERVEATLEDYERVRAKPTTFLLRHGHEHLDIERVVKKRRRYNVVEKFGAAVSRTVRELDPRAARGGESSAFATE